MTLFLNKKYLLYIFTVKVCLPFKIYIDHGHILTGNLKIINNLQLNKLMKNGMKYRLPSHTNANSILKQLTYDLDLFIYKISVSYNKPIEFFNQWKCLVIDKFKIALKNNSSHIVSFNKNQLF